MIEGINPVVQAFLGTLLTWGLTAAGSASVFFVNSKSASQQKTVLSSSLGFAAGVMIAASYWSLLAPGIEMAKSSDLWGSSKAFCLVPISGGFLLGALFVFLADGIIDSISGGSPVVALAVANEKYGTFYNSNTNAKDESYYGLHDGVEMGCFKDTEKLRKDSQWKRILLLIVAITVHNIPEGLAVGVGFGAIGRSPSATFEAAWTLAWGIGLQNFPEGLAVSLPLVASGFSHWRSFWYGQLSGMVEPIAGLLGAAAVYLFEPLLPWALAFAAGAMIYVVVSEVIPEARAAGHEKLASWSVMVGFIVMMSLDVGLG